MTLRESAKAETTCPDVMRLGVFFDGTGNNRFNDIREVDALKARNMAESEKKESAKSTKLAKFNEQREQEKKEDKRTNIAKLFSIYKDSTDVDPLSNKERRNYSIYKEGVGTNAAQDDYTTGLAAGDGGAKRILEAVNETERYFDQNPEAEVKRVIDVFGFSRGAAQARDFINTLYFRLMKNKFDIGFVGIIDTVGSFGLGGNNTNMKPLDPSKHTELDYLKYKSADAVANTANPFRQKSLVDEHFESYNFNLYSASAQKIVHLIASDEYRWTFPLSNISGAGGMHVEWQMIGAHSDIGGGYGVDFMDEGVDKQDFIVQEYFYDTDSEAMRLYIHKAESSGYFVEKVKSKQSYFMPGSTLYKVTVYSKRDIHPELHIVALHVLHQEALKWGVPVEDLPCNKDYQVPDDLIEYHEHAVSKPSQAMSYNGEFTPEDIRQDYVHRSHGNDVSRDGWIKSATEPPRRKKWNVPGVYTRTVFDNEPSKAIAKP